MRLARLHRRLASAMALSALATYAAGGGVTMSVLVTALALALSLAWLPGPRTGAWIERATRVGVLVLFGWLVYGAFVLRQDFMPGVIAMLLFLIGGEALRTLEARNDMRLYSLTFALVIAATAYYPGLGFGAGFVAYVALSVLAMMVGYLRRESERFRGTGAPVRVGRGFLWTTVALSGVTLAMSAAVFVLFPRLPRTWNVQGRRGAGAGEMAGFSDRVSIGDFGGRIASNPEVMFRVEFPDRPPADAEGIHWRGRSFNAFDGNTWTRSAGFFASDMPALEYARRWGGPYRRMRVFGGPPGADVLFGPQPVLAVSPRSAIHVYRGGANDVFFSGSDNPVYTVTTTAARPTDEELRMATEADGPALLPYLQLPALDPRVWRLADSLTAGRTARIDQVRAIERWLRDTFRYTLDLPSSASEASIEGFLFRRRAGHCEYFSTALAVLLRARGIPARNVNGFLGGEWNENGRYLAVTGNNAHSWVEVWFPEWGWVPFDATPPDRGELVARGTEGSWLWPARLWMDGMEYRWYKWVIDYNMERQISVFRGIGAMFSRDGRPSTATRPRAPIHIAGRWLIVIAGAGVLVLLVRARGRRRRRLAPESRAYLALRRAYARAGWAAETGDGPLGFARSLAREEAPGADDAAHAVDLYLRARFSSQPDDTTRAELAESAARARSAVRRAGKRRKLTKV
jgi:transglutaminase-like putative cysteine protease